MVESILLLDYFPWYSVNDECVEKKIKKIYGNIYSVILGRMEIDKLLREMFHRIERNVEIDMVIIPLMAGAITFDSAKRYYGQFEIPIITLPMSRHPWVTFSMDSLKEFESIMEAYSEYSIILSQYFKEIVIKRKPRNVLILDEAHDEGHIIKMASEYIRRELEYPVNIITATLINESNGKKNISPNEKEKVSVIDYYAIESRNNTRNFSHLYYLLKNMPESIVACSQLELLAFWKVQNSEHERIYNMYSSPKWFKHESGELFYGKSERAYAISELQKLDFFPRLIEDRKKFFISDWKENDEL